MNTLQEMERVGNEVGHVNTALYDYIRGEGLEGMAFHASISDKGDPNCEPGDILIWQASDGSLKHKKLDEKGGVTNIPPGSEIFIIPNSIDHETQKTQESHDKAKANVLSCATKNGFDTENMKLIKNNTSVPPGSRVYVCDEDGGGVQSFLIAENSTIKMGKGTKFFTPPPEAAA